MMRIAKIGILTGVLAGAMCGGVEAPAHAQAAPDSENGRFTFHRVEDGYLRLDARTGQVSICARKPVGWSCHPVPDERHALEGEIARLQTDNGLLKKELLARDIPLPGNVRKDPPVAKLPDVELKLPSDSDMERVFSFLEKTWRRLAEKMSAIQRDYFGKI
jgi:hypothetical protein